jgi:hypothetical protein
MQEASRQRRCMSARRYGEVPGRPSRLAALAPQDDGRASNHAPQWVLRTYPLGNER